VLPSGRITRNSTSRSAPLSADWRYATATAARSSGWTLSSMSFRVVISLDSVPKSRASPSSNRSRLVAISHSHVPIEAAASAVSSRCSLVLRSSSSRFSAVWSRSTLVKPRSPRSAARRAVVMPVAQNRTPSFRIIHRSSLALPSRVAVASSSAGTPAARSSGVKISATGSPTNSASPYPSTRPTPSFHEAFRPAVSIMKIA
jgi:hypothetical protein